jgi:hypothetical protein
MWMLVSARQDEKGEFPTDAAVTVQSSMCRRKTGLKRDHNRAARSVNARNKSPPPTPSNIGAVVVSIL